MADPIIIAKNATVQVDLLPNMANRHGLVAGATGTGKTVTLQALAEGFSRIGVPVFAADVKGDLAGASQAGGGNPHVDSRLTDLGMTAGWDTTPCPVMLWDVFGKEGQPIRATVSEMGPVLLARMLELNDVQEGVLNVAFRAADEAKLLLLDLKDLRAVLSYCSEHAEELQREYGNVSAASVGTIQRQLLTLEAQGGDNLFGEPALDLNDLMRTDTNGRGIINLLAADQLMQSPQVYATMLLWLLSELFEQLPEVGDLDKPKLVFFFDEAHLLFTDAPSALLQKIEQVVRLIRSKGVGVYFVTQNPTDIPDNVLGSSATRCSTRYARSRPRTRRLSMRWPRRSGPTRRWTWPPPSPSSTSARPSSRRSIRPARPCPSSARGSCRRTDTSARSRPSSAQPYARRHQSGPSTTRRWIARAPSRR